MKTSRKKQFLKPLDLFVPPPPPTKPMMSGAVSAGFYESPMFGDFPKIQILTVEGLLNETDAPKYPDLQRGALNFKRAEKSKNGNGNGTKSLFE